MIIKVRGYVGLLLELDHTIVSMKGKVADNPFIIRYSIKILCADDARIRLVDVAPNEIEVINEL